MVTKSVDAERVRTTVQAHLGALRRIQIRTRRRVTADLLGNYKSAFRGSGLDFEELREYEPGDEIRHIYWNASARAGKLYVKSYREERSLRVLLAVDISRSMCDDHRFDLAHYKSKFGRVIEFCALVGMLTAQGGDALGLCTFGEKVHSFFPPTRAPFQMTRVVGDLCEISDFSGVTDIKGALSQLIRQQRKSAVVFVISDFYSEFPEFELRALRARHQVVVLHVKDSIDKFPAQGLIEVQDQESGEIMCIDAAAPQFRTWWETETMARAQALELKARSCGADFATLGDEPLWALQSLFQKRAAHSWISSKLA